MAGGKRTSRKSSIAPKDSQEAAFSSLLGATIRALAIPEILISILSLCRKADLGRAALVSRKWSLVALDQLWRQLDSIIPLLLLFQPLQLALDTGNETIWEFDGNAADADWFRFRGYARRVRSLKFDENDTIFEEEESVIAFSSIQALALVHPFGPSLLPNLQQLSWCFTRDDTILSILPFVSSSLSTLEIDIEDTISEENSQRLFRSLTRRAPNLEHFKLSTAHPVTTINESLAQWLISKLRLRTVTLPQFFHTPEILASLGRLQRLEALAADWVYSNTSYIEQGTTLLFPDGSYPSLRTLHFHSSLTLATKLFRRPGPVSQLKAVCFSTLKCYPFKSLKFFLSALAQSCPELEVLLLNFTSVSIEQDAPDGPLTLNDIRPCLSLICLRELRVAYDFPLILRKVDVWEMSRSWKNLRVLRLCSDPDTGNALENAGTPITILKTFSVAFPILEHLSLYFHEKEVPQFEPDPAFQDGGFVGPLELDVGFSVVPGGDEPAIGYFIGNLCRRNPTITMTQTVWTRWSEFNGLREQEKEIQKWARVEKVAGMICQTKMSFKTRIQTLISNIEILEGMMVSSLTD